MNINELWIGDQVYIKSIAAYAIFQGKSANNLYKLKTKEGLLIETSLDDIAESPDKDLTEVPTDQKIKSETSKQTNTKSKITLDLSEEDLQEKYPRSYDSLADYQLEVCQEFLQSIIAKKITSAKIVYGLGQSALKSAVAALIRKHPEVVIYTPHPDQDAWDIWFDYDIEEEE